WPGQLRLQAFAHLANGANMVEYWHWHSIHNAIECHWKGVLSHDFTPGAVYQEAKTIGADLERIGSHLVNLKRKSDVAFLVSNRSLTGLKHSYAFAGPNYGDILRWLYDAFFRLNVSVDILDDSTRDFSAYKLVVTPGLYCAADSLIEALREYVRGGGNLLSSFRSFFCDENAKIRTTRQPGGLTDVFGMTYDNFTVPVDVPGAKEWMELLRPDGDTQVLLGYDHASYASYAAATCHTFGKGKAAYLGTMLDSADLDTLLEQLLPQMGIGLARYRWPLIVKQGTNDIGEIITYLLNYSSEVQTFHVENGAMELLSQKRFACGETLELEPWGAAMLCESAV
ncbi:MAG: beta-galactosidase trimerization domain-containing protein, partial [Candidatus Faecousia sp.]|nr:beta-galactosidase trimerization domain-containing protein [Candidatus Faecousia sp.]